MGSHNPAIYIPELESGSSILKKDNVRHRVRI